MNLKIVIEHHPECMTNRSRLAAILRDLYPNEKLLVNIALEVYECGIADKLHSVTNVDTTQVQAFCHQLKNEYALPTDIALKGLQIWADAYGVQLDTPSKTIQNAQAEIIHAPIIENIVEGCKSDYDIENINGAITIKKFIGFDEKLIQIPNSIDGIPVKIIGEDAFKKCTSVEKIIIPEGIERIQNGAFSGCSNLKHIVLPSTLLEIGTGAKRTAYGYSFFDGAFCNCPIEEINLPSSLNYLGAKTFQNCSSLKKIDIPNHVSSILESTFSGCHALKVVCFPDDIKSICKDAFYGTTIENIQLPNSIENIREDAFRCCRKLRSVSLPEGLIEIGAHAFENCSELKSIKIPKSVTTIGSGVFDITGWYQPYDGRRKGWGTRERNGELTILCYSGSRALEWARNEGYKVENAQKNNT